MAMLKLGVCVVLTMVWSAGANAQSLVGATVPDATGSDLVVIDPATGANDIYMRVNHNTALSRQLRMLTVLPDCKLAATLFPDNGTANNPQQFVKIDPLISTVSITNFGAPVGTLYSEGFEYSPRHNAFLIAFGALGNFGTNRLALINPADGSVISSTGALSGVTDMDYIYSTVTDDVVADYNATTASARVKHLTTLMPSPTLATFASPPNLTFYWDGSRHPTTGEIIFTDTDGSRLVRLVGNTYVNGATLADGTHLRGLTWANLPPRSIMPGYAGVCPGGSTSIHAKAVGTAPFTYKWRKDGFDIDSGVNPSAVTPDLSLTNANGGTQGTYDCVITNGCGEHTSATVQFILCVADLDCDGAVDDLDFQGFAAQYNILDCADPSMPAGCPSDFNKDGVVDDIDFQLFVPAYNRLLCGE